MMKISYTTRFLSILTSFTIAVCVLLCAAPCAYADTHSDTGLYLKAVDSPFVVTTPDKVTITVGDTVTLESTISGGFGEVEYSWSYSDDGGITWITLEGEQASELTITPDKVGDYLYRLTASDTNGQVAYVDYPVEVVSPNSAGANDPGDTSTIMATILPKTGDSSSLLVFALTALGAVAVLIVALRKRVFAGTNNMERETFLSKKPLALFIGIVAAAIMASLIVPASAHAAPVEDDTWFVVDQSLTATFDGEGNLSIPQATLYNNSDIDVILTSATGPDGYDWVCDGIGKTIPAHGSLSVQWTANEPVSSNVANEAALAGVLSIGAITYKTTDPVYTAFAVYSADDNSLNFYKRAEVPTAGTQFEGKTVTEVYTGIEEDRYYFQYSGGGMRAVSSTKMLPWNWIIGSISSVCVVDPIKPAYCDYWFNYATQCTHMDIANLDTSACTSMDFMFGVMEKLQEITVGEKFEFFGEHLLPAPNSTYIPKADGKWYDIETGLGYAPDDIPSNKAATYTAIPPKPALSGEVSVVGGSMPGDSLTATVSGLSDGAVPTYQWYRNGVAIQGAASASYTVTESDAGCTLVCKVSDTSGNYSGTLNSDAVNVKKKLEGTVTVNPNATVEGAAANISVNYTYSIGADPVIVWEYADDASGTNAAAVPIEENVIQCPIWGKYIRAILTDGSGTYYGSVSSDWTGPATTEFYGSVEILGGDPVVGERPGLSVIGPILTDGQSDLSNYKITWWAADDASGANKEPYAPLNDGGYIEDNPSGPSYLAVEVSVKDEWSAYVTGSVMSEWVHINRSGEPSVD